PVFVITQDEKLTRKAMILLRKCHACHMMPEEILKVTAQIELRLYTASNYSERAKKDDEGHILITKENLDAIPDEVVSDSYFNSKQVWN
ncbi:MAG: hypothetical protein ACKO5E_20110, partial [bacterium]